MKRLLIIIGCLCFFLTASAMDENTKRINTIKKDTTYLYSDVTLPTQEEAMKQACEQLVKEIRSWIIGMDEKLQNNVSFADISDIVENVTTRRVEQYRVLAYVSKDQVRQLFQTGKGGAIEQIKKAKYFFELKGIMEPLKQSGEIIDYGKYATMKNPEECYLIVYDAAGNILALLDKGNDERRNLTTNNTDKLMNYRGYGAIWFILK